jgi:hypothetical protein
VADFGRAGIDLFRGGTTETFEGLEISGNRIFVEGAAAEGLVGIALRSNTAGPWLERAVVTGNSISENVATKIARGNGVFVLAVGGNPNGAVILEGEPNPAGQTPESHTPEHHVPAPPGSLFLQNATELAALYYKESGATRDGWRRVGLLPPDG